jgi:hypothetical protein
LERWRSWWQEAFAATPLWRSAGGSFMPPVDAARLPASLLERFVGADAAARLSGLLRWLGPLTVGTNEHASDPATEHAA